MAAPPIGILHFRDHWTGIIAPSPPFCIWGLLLLLLFKTLSYCLMLNLTLSTNPNLRNVPIFFTYLVTTFRNVKENYVAPYFFLILMGKIQVENRKLIKAANQRSFRKIHDLLNISHMHQRRRFFPFEIKKHLLVCYFSDWLFSKSYF